MLRVGTWQEDAKSTSLTLYSRPRGDELEERAWSDIDAIWVTGPYGIPTWRAAAPGFDSEELQSSGSAVKYPKDWLCSHTLRTCRVVSRRSGRSATEAPRCAGREH